MPVLTAEQVARLAFDAGFRGENLVIAVAVAKGESGFRSDALGDQSLRDQTWSNSVGLFQVRCLHAERGTGGVRDEVANLDPAHNARSAWEISGRGAHNFRPWSVFTNNAYRTHLESVRPACRSVDPTVGEGGDEQPLLKSGSEGPAVATLQGLLTKAGFPCGQDGKFGSETESQVKAFQGAKGLALDGIVGPPTWAALRPDVRWPETFLKLGSQGPDVATFQRRLLELGFDLGPSGADGDFGTRTDAATRRFQTDRGLAPDGVVGQATWTAAFG